MHIARKNCIVFEDACMSKVQGLPYYKKSKPVFCKSVYALVSYSLVQAILVHGLQYIVLEYIYMHEVICCVYSFIFLMR